MLRTRSLIVLGLLTLMLVVPAGADARTNVQVGVADQTVRRDGSVPMFNSAAYRRLNTRITRYFIKWDSIRKPAELAQADAFMRGARARRVSVLMHISTNNLTPRRAKLPTVRQYRDLVGRLVRRYRSQGVREWGVWNEANNKTQPTWRSPQRAAQYFRTMRQICRGCRIVALDVLDQPGEIRYLQRFFRALGRDRTRVQYVGIHNYGDTNRPSRRGRQTREIINQVRRYNRRAKVWLTETGGLAEFGRSFPCNTRRPQSAERRQARAVTNTLRLAKTNRRYVQRLYVYNWVGTDCRSRFDAGLTRRNGRTRPAYSSLRRGLSRGYVR